jgi:hypothetical protein
VPPMPAASRLSSGRARGSARSRPRRPDLQQLHRSRHAARRRVRQQFRDGLTGGIDPQRRRCDRIAGRGGVVPCVDDPEQRARCLAGCQGDHGRAGAGDPGGRSPDLPGRSAPEERDPRETLKCAQGRGDILELDVLVYRAGRRRRGAQRYAQARRRAGRPVGSVARGGTGRGRGCRRAASGGRRRRGHRRGSRGRRGWPRCRRSRTRAPGHCGGRNHHAGQACGRRPAGSPSLAQ